MFEASHAHTGINGMMGAIVNGTSAAKKRDKIASILGFRKPARAAPDSFAQLSPPSSLLLSTMTAIVAKSNNANTCEIAEMEQDPILRNG
jgi:hypothetical protein